MSYPCGPPEPPFSVETLVSYFHTVVDALPDQRTGYQLKAGQFDPGSAGVLAGLMASAQSTAGKMLALPGEFCGQPVSLQSVPA